MVGEFASGGNVSRGKVVRDGLLYGLWLRSLQQVVNPILERVMNPMLRFVTLVCMIAVTLVPLP